MVMDGLPDNERLAQIGVARISYGPSPYIQAMNGVRERAARL
jgi:2-methylisocitrate lyase-like PEP mutase family enzyme